MSICTAAEMAAYSEREHPATVNPIFAAVKQELLAKGYCLEPKPGSEIIAVISFDPKPEPAQESPEPR